MGSGLIHMSLNRDFCLFDSIRIRSFSPDTKQFEAEGRKKKEQMWAISFDKRPIKD